MPTPSLGRIVLVPMDPAENNGATTAPAVITRVWSPTTINVRILADSHDTPWRTSLAHAETLEDSTDNLCRWTWPERT